MLIETGHLSDADLGHQRHKIVVRTGEMAHMAAARGRNMSGGSDTGNRKQTQTKNKRLDNGEELKVHLPLKQQRETLLC